MRVGESEWGVSKGGKNYKQKLQHWRRRATTKRINKDSKKAVYYRLDSFLFAERRRRRKKLREILSNKKSSLNYYEQKVCANFYYTVTAVDADADVAATNFVAAVVAVAILEKNYFPQM